MRKRANSVFDDAAGVVVATGHPAVIVAGFTDQIAGRLRAIGRVGRRLHQIAGVVMILMGLAMMTGQLSALSYWMLDAFPILGRIG